nr:putative ribonuclease H-like domain-containing protein [Tanacetum cinerariifolium]
MRIEQYFLMTDYSLWEVILNGDSPVPTRVVEGVLQPVTPTTTEQRLAKKNELKACGTYLMDLPDKHQLKFNSHKDANTLMEAIEKRFSRNTETKKVQKTLLKQQIKNFTGSSSEVLDQIHDRLQKLVTQLEIHGVSLSQEDVNLNTADSVSAAASVSAACAKLPASLFPNIDVDDLKKMDLRWQMAMLTMRAKRFLQKTGKNLGANGPTSMGFDMSKVECYNCHMMGHFARECRSPKDPKRPEEEPANFALMAFSSNSSSDNEVPSCSKACSKAYAQLHTQYNKLTNDFCKSQFNVISYQTESDYESWPPSNLYDRFQPSGGYHAVPPPYTRTFMPPRPDLMFNIAPTAVETNHLTFNQIKTTIPAATPVPASLKSNSSGQRRNRKACFVCKSVDHLIKDCDYHTKKMAQPTPRNYAHRGHHKQYAPLTHSKPQKHMVPTAMLTQSKPVSNTVVRSVSAAFPNISVTLPRHAYQVVTKFKSPIRRHITRSPSSRTSNSPPIVTVVKAPVVSVAQGNMSYLSDFEEINGGYVAFGGNPKGGKITGKGKIKTGKLDFDDVYFVKELKFNLFSVSQMCDKKNSVLFTETECLVLSFDFKLPDESQVLLRVPRENNMYNVNLKNIVPSGDLTCLFAKVTLDESNLWHRRLAYINFKTINKLVKCNLVRGLPTKVFENNHTCVACKKGKQNRASCKAKPVSSVDQPLFRLHRDLFGPTFVKSLNKKSYCLVITDDYSRFTWLFFFTTKDETSPILKTFITGLENQLSLKVKVIKSDNATEFKNSDLNQFCGLKGIKREFSVPRTPQQNGIVKRKNRTVIEAARTMLADLLLPIPFWAEAVNTACYIQNRVLATKSHNKTPYELLHGRTPSIGFMRPFGCPVTNLNTLDHLGKFQGKVDEGFLVGYSVCSKAFRVFNSRTRIIQETLHVNFLENQPNVVGTGPTWLFDIDSLTRTMNYQPVHTGNQTNPGVGFQDKFDVEKAGEEVDQSYMLFLVWSAGSTNPHNNAEDTAFDGKEHDFGVNKLESKVILAPSSSAQSKKQDDKTKKEAKIKSHIESVTCYRDLNAELEDCSENSSNEVNAASSIVPTVGQNSLNNTNTFSVVGPSNDVVSPTYGKSSFIDASQLPDDLDMPELAAITYSNDEDVVGTEADFNNLESSIPVSPIPTTRIHKDHIVSQIIGDLSSTTQTRSMTRAVKDQGGLSQMFGNDFHTCMFACFLSQEEPNRLHQALKDPSWIEAMQKELLQFKMQKVWVLVNLPYGKRAIGTKWVYRNKKDERGIVIRNKARLVTQGHTHRRELTIKRSVCLSTPGFEDPDHLDKVYKVVKALYGLHQAPRARVGQGFSRVETPLFEGMLVGVFEEEGDAEEQVQDDVDDAAAQGADTAIQGDDRIDTSKDSVIKDASNQGRMIDDLDKDDAVDLMDDKGEEKKEERVKDYQVKGRQAEIYQIDMDHASKVLSMQEDEPAEVHEVVDVVTTAKLITEVVTTASESVTAASTTISAAEPQVPAATITAVPVRVAAASTKRRKRVVIKDPEEESTTIMPADTKSKDKGKGIMVEELKPLKKKQQVEIDEEYVRKLHKEINKDINWNVAIDHVKQKAKEDPFVQRYQLDYFKRMSYDDIRPIFEDKFNSNIAFLFKTKGQLEEEENIAIESINKTLAQKAAKKRKLNKEAEDLKRHLEIMPDEDDDVYTEGTPLARKVPVVDYEIIHLNNKPNYKIIRADGTHQLYVSFLTLLKNREDLESLWSLVKEIFYTSKPSNFSDDFLPTTLRAMFERPDGQAQVWKSQRSIHGLAKVKS